MSSKALKKIEPRVLLAIALIVAALWAVLSIASEVMEGDTLAFDNMLLLAFRVAGDPATPIGPRWLQEVGRDITALGGITMLTLVTLLSTALLLIERRLKQAIVFATTVVAAQITSAVVKHFVNRPRPDIATHFDLTYSASFPSGHALMAPVVYFTLAAIVAAGTLRAGTKLTLLASAGILVFAIGISRVYLGVHWPSDVLAGWTIGCAFALAGWLALSKLALEDTET